MIFPAVVVITGCLAVVSDQSIGAPPAWRPGATAACRRGLAARDPGRLAAGAPGTSQPSDSLSSNELHHPELFRTRAQSVIRGLTEPATQVRAILEKVRAAFPYKTGDDSILYFTWADDLIDEKTGGVCDERAVMAVSWLRAVNIPARLVYLYFENSDHTSIEFYDGKRWVLADPESATVNDRRVYGRSGRLLRVVIRHHPRDARKSARVHKLVDDPHDRKMNPEGDFLETEVDPDRWLQGRTAPEDPPSRRRASAAHGDDASTSR